jgi:DNA polymerase III subunit gamma/tau
MDKSNQKVFALKYRPKNFKELIGQDIMVQTIVNSIKSNNLPNAYLLTGIRGTGKTTTARLIAKVLNCAKNFIAEKPGEYCDCKNCEEISNSSHLDVLEMDAASRTGIDDIRELIESSRYNPTSAKYKIFIIDEIHMLSKQAFNGLLKTLEEPPAHLKFIFATTEVKKIPVTIISRCQRFDLHRVPISILMENLTRITKIEKGKISENALRLIAKAAEGSVRDSLSLLNRAIVSQSITEKEVDENYIRKMLGIADRSKILLLLKLVFQGNQKKSLELLKEMINEGLEPTSFLNDLLEIIYFIQQKKDLGNFDTELSISEAETEVIKEISNDVETSTLILFWQFILKGLDEIYIVANPLLSLEMLIIRLLHLKEMPSYDDLVNKNIINEKKEEVIKNEFLMQEKTEEEKDVTQISKKQIKSTAQEKPDLILNNQEKLELESIKSFGDLIKLSSKKKEVELKYDLERNVNLIKFSEGKIDIAFNENLSKNFVRNLSEKLLAWTKKRWVITLAKGEGQKTFLETKSINEKDTLDKEKKGDLYKKFKSVFDDIELVDVSEKD